jgi:signal transduction histidine kinase
MTNPARSLDPLPGLGANDLDARPTLRRRLPDVGRIGARRLLIVLDVAAILVIVGTFAQVAPPELLFHVVFVILTAEAFVYGRRICLERIVAVSVALVVYASLPTLGVEVAPLELTEWPLMFTIAVLVAWMADREQSVGRRYASLYRETRDRLVRAQEEERGRLARDLHDGLGQTLTALTLNLDAASSTADADGRAEDLARAGELAREAIDDTRRIAERVRPPRLAERGLASALQSMASAPGGRVEVAIGRDADVRLMSADTELETYRIAQEAVRNAIDHADARHIRLSLDRRPTGLWLGVVDDGRGFDPRTVDPRRLGIVGMRERAAAIGATLRIESATGHGTHVSLTIPGSTDMAVG